MPGLPDTAPLVIIVEVAGGSSDQCKWTALSGAQLLSIVTGFQVSATVEPLRSQGTVQALAAAIKSASSTTPSEQAALDNLLESPGKRGASFTVPHSTRPSHRYRQNRTLPSSPYASHLVRLQSLSQTSLEFKQSELTKD